MPGTKAPAWQGEFLRAIKLIWGVRMLCGKYFGFPETQITCIVLPVPLRCEGRFAIVTNARRDAMDAAASGAGEQSSRARRTMLLADGEVVWSWRLDPGVKLAEDILPAMVARTADHQGDHEGNR
jgi:hypothetical protein